MVNHRVLRIIAVDPGLRILAVHGQLYLPRAILEANL